jgi:hypothetical protein
VSRFVRAFQRRGRDRVVTGYRGLPGSHDEAIAALTLHVRGLGCDCAVEVYLDAPLRRGEVSRVRVEHESTCALVRRGLVA